MPSSMQLIHCIIVMATMVAAQSNGTSTPTMSPVPAVEPTNIDSVPTKTPLSVSNPTCYSNLTEIEVMLQNKNPFFEETYVICPDTVYEISTDGSDESAFRPIIPRAKSIFKCGDDGKSSNNCVLSGGVFQISSTLGDFPNENRVGVVFQGFTFEGGLVASAFLVAGGDITFVDCVFQKHTNDGVILAIFVPIDERRLTNAAPNLYDPVSKWEADFNSLKTPQTARHDGRDLQDAAADVRQVIIFDKCIFRENSYGTESDTSEDGVITAYPYNDIVLRSCIFQNNSYAQPLKGENSYAVWVQDGQLTISDTCFIDNNFAGAGVVLVSNTSTFNESSNFGTLSDDLACPFAAVGAECVAFSSGTCSADIYTGSIAPNSGPTVVPVEAPNVNTPTINATSDSVRHSCLPQLSLLLLLSLVLVAAL